MLIFSDQQEAGAILSEKLQPLKPKLKNPLVLGIPRGGVPIGFIIAKTLGCSTVHKLRCKGITIYRYGTKKEQVLSFSGQKGRVPKFVTAASEYSCGCASEVCA